MDPLIERKEASVVGGKNQRKVMGSFSTPRKRRWERARSVNFLGRPIHQPQLGGETFCNESDRERVSKALQGGFYRGKVRPPVSFT